MLSSGRKLFEYLIGDKDAVVEFFCTFQMKNIKIIVTFAYVFIRYVE